VANRAFAETIVMDADGHGNGHGNGHGPEAGEEHAAVMAAGELPESEVPRRDPLIWEAPSSLRGDDPDEGSSGS
jgi:hypothetical protein